MEHGGGMRRREGLIERSSGRAGRGTRGGGVAGWRGGSARRSDRPAVTNLRPFVLPILIPILPVRRTRIHTYAYRARDVRTHIDDSDPLDLPFSMPMHPLSLPFRPLFPIPASFPWVPRDPRARWHPPAKRYSSQKVALCRSVSRPPQKFHAYLDRRHHLFAPR